MIEEDIKILGKYLDNCYSPYSKFNVVAMVKTNKNQKYYGVNVENASYSMTICAERVAITNAITNGMKKNDLEYIVICSNTCDSILPCGACLQVLSEFTDDKYLKIYTIGNNNKINIYELKDLLPKIFTL